jgi:hypothetical protein
MRHNKVLGLAIASALALGANSSFSGEKSLTVKYKDDLNADCASSAAPDSLKTAPATFASELFFSGDKTVLSSFPCNLGNEDLDNSGVDGAGTNVGGATGPNDGYFYAVYNFDTKVLGESPFLARFQLSNNAQFSEDVSLANGLALDFVAHPSASHAGVTKSGALGNGGAAGDTQVTFYITPKANNGFTKNLDTLVLRFNMKNLGVLKTPGENIQMTAEVFADPTGTNSFDGGPSTAVVATSAKATKADVSANGGTGEIDVGQDSKVFVGSAPLVQSPTIVVLGSVYITRNTSVTALKDNGQIWKFGSDATPAGGTITLENAPLSASISDPGKVFLDFKPYDNKLNDPPPSATVNDIAATTIENGTATWELTADQLKTLYSDPVDGVNIVIEADGTTTIEQQRDPAKVTFTIDYGGGNKDSFSRNLAHIKQNGVVCTLYNVPSPGAQDTGNIRITNTSTKEGKIRGSLRDINGDYVFINQELMDALAPYATLYLNSETLNNIPKDQKWIDKYGEDSWQGRAVLTINSNVKSLEAYGLLRNKMGGALTNMSVGATGNGCD